MSYTVKEIFYSLQGEGHHSGRPAVFCRFSGCNLWSGREEDRARAQCTFCDTDFVGVGPDGGKFADAQALARRIASHWPAQGGGTPYVVCTGGEPTLQLDAALIDALHDRGFQIAIETNGSRPVPAGLDWVCVSPKAGVTLAVVAGDELKLVWPQDGIDPAELAGLAFRHAFLQPMDGPDRGGATQDCVRYCLTHPRWRLSLQTHKLLGIP